jgi:ubiquinone/menaquinone biosynthesis C-methylase UbiE
MAEAMLRMTRQSAVEAGVSHLITTSVGDVHRLAYPSNTFGLVLAIGVIPWLHSPQSAIEEMGRVLKPHGHLIVTADNSWRLNHVLDPSLSPPLTSARRSVRAILQRVGLRRPQTTQSLPRLDSIPKFDGWLSSAGLTKVKGRTVGFGPFTFRGHRLLRETTAMHLHYRLQKLADRMMLGVESSGSHYIVLARK